MKKSCRFTLIELLVVVAIIAVLATMLFPVTASVRGRGRESVCLANIRQVGMLHQLYADNNNGLFCPAWDASYNQWDTAGNYKDPGLLATALPEADANHSEVYSCPEARISFDKNTPWAPTFAGYGYNYLLSFPDSKSYPPNYRFVSAGKVHRPASVSLVADAACFFSATQLGATSFLLPPSSHSGGYADFRHFGKAVTVYADGHAASSGKIFRASGINKDFADRAGYLSKDDSAYDPYFTE